MIGGVIDAIMDTLLRMFPRRVPTGLVRIGNPGPGSPVLLTGNFRLTVARVKRALAGLDAWLLVADSGGVNVWCAATGGRFTNHDVVNALKISGIAERVDHTSVILPQLAATGIDGDMVRAHTGWRVVWGPVRADDIPAFLQARQHATTAMRTVDFPWRQRVEMAVAWAFPISVVGGFIAAVVWMDAWFRLMGLIWASALAIFLAFPLYGPGLGDGVPRHRERLVPLVLWLVFMGLLLVGQLLTIGFDPERMLYWGVAELVIVLLVGNDLSGSTPLFKSGMFADRRMRIKLDADLCTGAGFCETVCPVNVFEVDHHRKTATLPRQQACVQCGACIVQCPFDALSFRTRDGGRITPETIRTYKLNLLGKRVVHAP